MPAPKRRSKASHRMRQGSKGPNGGLIAGGVIAVVLVGVAFVVVSGGGQVHMSPAPAGPTGNAGPARASDLQAVIDAAVVEELQAQLEAAGGAQNVSPEAQESLRATLRVEVTKQVTFADMLKRTAARLAAADARDGAEEAYREATVRLGERWLPGARHDLAPSAETVERELRSHADTWMAARGR